jgi:hypothetical protein
MFWVNLTCYPIYYAQKTVGGIASGVAAFTAVVISFRDYYLYSGYVFWNKTFG